MKLEGPGKPWEIGWKIGEGLIVVLNVLGIAGSIYIVYLIVKALQKYIAS